jgi:hypothetical protein
MPRVVAFILAGLLSIIPVNAWTQTWLPETLLLGQSLDYGDVQIVPSLKLGYQTIGMNISLPIPFSGTTGFELFSSSTLDLKLRDPGVWVGGLRLDIRRGGLSLFVSAEGSAATTTSVLTQSEPFWAGFYSVNWTGTGFQWWTAGGGGTIPIKGDMNFVAGIRTEQISLSLDGAVDTNGIIQSFQSIFGDRYKGDLLTRLWVPYIGLRIDGSNFKSTLLFSPYTWANIDIPFRYLFINTPLIAFEDAQYKFKNGGILIESTLDYNTEISENQSWGLWLKASWCGIRGGGSEAYKFDTLLSGTPFLNYSLNSESTGGSYTSYTIGGGIYATYVF